MLIVYRHQFDGSCRFLITPCLVAESSESSGAPVAQPEMDSPLPTSTREAENDQNEANKNVNEDTQRKPKNTADETRNGKLTEKNEATVNKKCCCIL